MIAELRGTLLKKGPAEVVVGVGGVGFRLLVPLSTYRALGVEGDDVHVFTHLHVKDDALELFGFCTEAERQIFKELISVSGIGPKLGLAVLSGLSPEVLQRAIVEEDLGLLTSISGIGRKTAQRLIVDLKERLSGMDVSSIGAGGERDREQVGDAVLALVALGMRRQAAREAVLRVRRESGEELPLDEIIVRALRKGD
jgi:Holliday junction DNA helicase RuvA